MTTYSVLFVDENGNTKQLLLKGNFHDLYVHLSGRSEHLMTYIVISSDDEVLQY